MTSSRDARRSLLGEQLARANTDLNPTEPLRSSAPRVGAGAVGAVSRSLGRFEEELQAARAAAQSGERVVDIETSLIDPSWLRDRLEGDDDEQAALVAAIKEHGQSTPILVRPSVSNPGRYQVAFGHRRLNACTTLGIPVKAVVKDLSDEALAIAQGQENAARRDLSYIERAVFAQKLIKAGYSRDVAMAALATDKTELSKLLAIAQAVPSTLITLIGPAPKAGRPRWLGLAERTKDPVARHRLIKEFVAHSPSSMKSDDRFALAFRLAGAAPKRTDRPTTWINKDEKSIVRIQRKGPQTVLVIDDRVTPDFAAFLETKLPELYEAYKAS